MKEHAFCPFCGKGLAPKTIEGRERKACPGGDCGYVFWDNPLPVVAALIEQDGRILLARNRSWPEKVFGLITGFIERNESPDGALVREVREELGLEANAPSLIGVYGFPHQNQIIIAYHCTAAGEPVPGEEIAETRWVPVEKLRPWNFGTGFAVRDFLGTRAGRYIR